MRDESYATGASPIRRTNLFHLREVSLPERLYMPRGTLAIPNQRVFAFWRILLLYSPGLTFGLVEITLTRCTNVSPSAKCLV